jgi:hypothetical protein
MADFHNDTEVARRIATQKRKRILAMRHNTAIVVVTKCTDQARPATAASAQCTARRSQHSTMTVINL